MSVLKKPTRRDLLIVITRLQGLVGEATSAHGNDRDPNGFQKGQEALVKALELCIRARRFDPPMDGVKSRNGWGYCVNKKGRPQRYDIYIFGEEEPRVCIYAFGFDDAEEEAGQDLCISPAKLYAVMHETAGSWQKKRVAETA